MSFGQRKALAAVQGDAEQSVGSNEKRKSTWLSTAIFVAVLFGVEMFMIPWRIVLEGIGLLFGQRYTISFLVLLAVTLFGLWKPYGIFRIRTQAVILLVYMLLFMRPDAPNELAPSFKDVQTTTANTNR